jgi:hypothetical protein
VYASKKEQPREMRRGGFDDKELAIKIKKQNEIKYLLSGG